MTLFTSRSATIALKDPITDAVLITLTTQLRGLPTSESLEYVDRQYARSGAVSSVRLRSKGQLSIDKTPDGMALVRELKRWQDGVIYYPLTSDLKGKTYRHPNLEISITNSGTTELITAYGVRLASRSFDLPLSGPASDSISLDVLRGFDLTATETLDQGEPFKALTHFRTGTATYVSTSGTFTTAGDGVARFGVSNVTRRNLLLNSESTSNLSNFASTTTTPNQGADSKGRAVLIKVVTTASNGGFLYSSGSYATTSAASKTLTGSMELCTADGSTKTVQIRMGMWGGAEYLSSPITINGTPARYVYAYTFGAGETGQAYTGIRSDNQTILVGNLQLEIGSLTAAQVVYQATNATGVDLSNPINGAGIVLEGAGTNLVKNSSFLTDALNWTQILGAGGARVALSGTSSGFGYQMTYTTGNPVELQSDWITVTAGTAYSLSGKLATGDPSNGTLRVAWYTAPGGALISYSVIGINNTALTYYSSSFTAPTGATAAYIQFYRDAGATGTTIQASDIQFELSPFPTSFIQTPSNSTGTRSPDLCALTVPHNLLVSSTDLTNSAYWASSQLTLTANTTDVTAPDGTNTALKAAPTGGATDCSINNGAAIGPGQSLDPTQYYSFPVWMRTLSGTASIPIRIGDQTQVATAAITSTWQRFDVTVKPASHGYNWSVAIGGWSGWSAATGTIYIWHPNLHQGAMPGMDVPTTSQALPKPTDGTEWPSWMTQNGAIEFDCLPQAPDILPSSGGIYTYIGAGNWWNNIKPFTLYRYPWATGTGYLKISALTDKGLVQPEGSCSGFWDGAKHRVRMEWTNYILGGVRYMYFRLYIDGVKKMENDAAAILGATAWIAPERFWLSDGSTYATISDLAISVPTVPTGAIPA